MLSILYWFTFAAYAFGDTMKVIKYDMGGALLDRMEEVSKLSGVIIDGPCYSACTLYLGAPKTCVTTRARLGFHSPAWRGGKKTLKPYHFELATQWMADHYPEPLRTWWMQTARHSRKLSILTGEQAVLMGAKLCS
jgi:hypothetical protein